MSLCTFKATVRKKEGLKVEGESRGFKVIADEPESLGGTNTGMNPVEMLLCSLGACQTIVAASFAKKLRVELEDFWVDLEGDLDTDGFMGVSDVRPGYSNIRFNFHIKSNSPEKNIKELVELIEKRCPVGDTLANLVKLENAKITIEK
ncbi:OsmC family protein [Clostridium thailandense]|uniref:OsmC family protein n=1 Tax=Clostridium thailandense TaxID=2794346 RepID=A0A949WT63_9CLOT|nr:OsmC family protein [Clostridium thailandense]MBV7275960.1 OsmC family protein [Clostridium thailandense]